MTVKDLERPYDYVALLLRELGRAPGNVDLLLYDAERHQIRAW